MTVPIWEQRKSWKRSLGKFGPASEVRNIAVGGLDAGAAMIQRPLPGDANKGAKAERKVEAERNQPS